MPIFMLNNFLNRRNFKVFARTFIIFFLMSLCNFAFANNELAYSKSIVEASVHHPGAITTPLATLDGPYVRMTTFTNYQGYKTTDKTLDATIWTVVDSDLKNHCQQFVKNHPHATPQQLTLWIAELLGVSPYQAETRQLVTFNVSVIQAYYGVPENKIGIFRPCTDPRIRAHADGSVICPTRMNANDNNISSSYKTWFINNSIDSYTLNTKDNHDMGAPWTEYGYTYNWNPHARSVLGISEFVVLKNTPVTVLENPNHTNTVYVSAEEYCGLKS